MNIAEIEELVYAAEALYVAIPDLTGDIDLQIATWKALKPLRDRATVAMKELEAMIIDAADGKAVTETPSGVAQLRWSMKRNQWRSNDLLHAICMTVYAEDIECPQGELVAKVEKAVRECGPFNASAGWRTTALKEYGFSPEDYCHEQPGAVTVEII